MKKVVKASDDQIAVFLLKHPRWQLKDQKLHRVFTFKHFQEAFGFMTQAAILSEKLNHHPEWFNVYNRVVIDMTTHEVDGISQRDFDWIEKIERID